MPKIPIYESQTTTPQTGPGYMQGLVGLAGQGPAYIAEATQNLSRGVNYAAEKIQEYDDQSEQLKALKDISAFKIERAQQMRDRQENAQPGAPQFVEDTLADFDKTAEALKGKYKNPKAQALLEQNLASLRYSFGNEAIGFHAKSQTEMKFADAQTTVDNSAKIVRADPSKLQAEIDATEAYLRVANLPPAQQERVRKLARDSIGTQAVRGMIDNDPWNAEKKIRSGELDDSLSAQSKDQLINIARAEQRHRTAEANQAKALRLAETQSLAQNYVAQLAVNKDAPLPPQLSYDKMISSIGQKAADSLMDGVQQAKIQADDSALIRTMAPADRKQFLGELQAAVGAKPEGASLALHRLQSAVAATERAEQEFKADPAQYAVKYNPTVAASYKAFADSLGNQNTTPERQQALFRDYKISQEAYQSNNGNPTPQILTAPLAETMGNMVALAKTPEDKVRAIRNIANMTGQDMPQVMAQIGKHIPPAALFTTHMSDRAAADLMNATTQAADLEKALPKEKKKEISDKVVEKTAAFGQTIAHTLNSANRLATLNSAIDNMAKLYVSQGVDPSTAVDKAYKSVIEDHYKIYDTFTVPKAEDKGNMKRSAQTLVQGIAPDQLALPADRSQYPNVEDKQLREKLASSLKSNPSFVTTDDEKGIYVRYPDGTIAVGADGKPITFTWQQLRSATPATPDNARRGLAPINSPQRLVPDVRWRTPVDQ